jgi:hypothetical protein
VSGIAPAEARPAFSDGDAQALFEEARRRARRRRRRQGSVAALVLALIGGAAWIAIEAGGGAPSDRAEPGPAITEVMPSQLFSREPYMGVSCRRPNSIACDRIGLAVWTKDPFVAVSATIGRRTFTLPWGDAGYCCRPEDRSRQPRRQFIGFLYRAGMRGPGPLAVRVENGRNRFTGVHPTSAQVRVVATYSDGARQATTVRLGLAPGWG